MATEHGGRVMHQPRKSVLRDTLAKAADTIAEKNAEIDRLVREMYEPREGSVSFRVEPWRDRVRMVWALLRGNTIQLNAVQVVTTQGDA